MLLLTGASGAIGKRIISSWNDDVIALVHRRKVRASVCVEGDVTKPALGIRKPPLDKITAILHCAALTEFSATPLKLKSVNVLGVRNLIALARKCPRLEKIGILSTAYVAGKRTGRILESELDHRSGFVNPYERSKYDMERFSRRNMRELPIAIYRLTTILGDSSSGRVDDFNALHIALRLYYHALVPMVPGVPGSFIDLISLDYAANCITHLFRERFLPGQTFHITAPHCDRLPLDRFLDLTAEIFSRHSERWSGALSPPPIVPLNTFRLLEKSARIAGNPVMQQVLSSTSSFLPQLCFPKDFDRSNLCHALQGSGIEPRPLMDYYPDIVRECIQSKEVFRRRERP